MVTSPKVSAEEGAPVGLALLAVLLGVLLGALLAELSGVDTGFAQPASRLKHIRTDSSRAIVRFIHVASYF
jgi:hypothetical protein